ncbi:class Ia ribonucleoside-diphosphate reductase subunit beta [Thiosulfativibrio zosterae]|uniref:ribonucleoside-diphosphate reductase n=1 Tax=Thiosulfativibrio zosterae TaxID=2675053 RepID=A0A6F8PPX3_9GAMM|nr:class Ia ribonucleoside-diphosphate reductase subunit beta [Thiosulfativibrio zosterae]BBP44155.1 ribonucleoside-diphosphate reductase subunit beta [Thiosulfativibrio zosterae]
MSCQDKHTYSTFCRANNNALKEPMFFGQNVNVARYDQQKHPIFEKLIEKQLSFFWRPEEVDLSSDRSEYAALPDNEKHIFISNLKYQTLLDSVQGRSPNVALLPVVSIPELETWIETWSFSETIHSRSYTHIIRNIVSDPALIFDDIVTNEEIVKRAISVTQYYDELIDLTNQMYANRIDLANDDEYRKKIKTALFLTVVSVNVLEAIRFYVSFACSFSFAERSLMEGNAKVIKLIARDEALHLSGTQHMINIMTEGQDDPEMAIIAKENEDKVYQIFRDAAEQEKQWAEYLFKNGSMIGLNAKILKDYVEYITNVRIKALKLQPIFESKSNPLPWMNNWLVSDNVQVAPQESEISSYLVGQVDSKVGTDDFSDFSL